MTELELKHQFITLRAQGYSFDHIAKELNRSKQTLINWSKELEEDIANQRALELEALYEKCLMTKENRIRLLADNLARIKRELNSRDLHKIPSEKLIELMLKHLELMKEEYLEPQFMSEEEVASSKQLRTELQELITSMKDDD